MNQSISPEKIARYIDHTLLKPEADEMAIRTLCQEAIRYNFYSVCVNPTFVPLAAKELAGSNVKVCTVVGFPLGASLMSVKAFEAQSLISRGAQEIDMVMNISAFKSEDFAHVKRDIEAVVEASGTYPVKVIIETALLNRDEIIKATEIVRDSGALFIKTSTGFSSKGAQLEDVKLMSQVAGGKIQIKASGGIKDYETALAFINAGATRIGTSSGIKITQKSL